MASHANCSSARDGATAGSLFERKRFRVGGAAGRFAQGVRITQHSSAPTSRWGAVPKDCSSQRTSSCSCSRWEQSLSIRSLATLTRMLLPSSRLRERGNEVTYGTRYRQDKQWLAEGERLPELPE